MSLNEQLLIAVRSGSVKDVTSLLKKGADPNTQSVLWDAIPHYEIAVKLIVAGADVYQRNNVCEIKLPGLVCC